MIQIGLRKLHLVVVSLLLSASLCLPARADIANPGFESGTFAGWTALGGASVVTSFLGVTPVQGSYMAMLDSANALGGFTSTLVQSFMPGAQPLQAWVNFITYDAPLNNDSASLLTTTLNNGVQSTQFNWQTAFFPNPGTPGLKISGWQNVQLDPGTNSLQLLLFNQGGASANTYVLFDVSPIPEPSTYLLLLAGFGLLGLMVRFSRRRACKAAAALLLGAGIAAAPVQASLTNPGFESGNLNGWYAAGDVSVASTAFGYAAPQGSFMAVLNTANSLGGFMSLLGQGFTPGALPLRVWVNFISEDSLPFNDSITLNTMTTTSSVPSVQLVRQVSDFPNPYYSGRKDTGWITFDLAPNTNFVQLHLTNVGDYDVDSVVLFDISPIPEPSIALLMLAGLGMLGMIGRRRLRRD